MLHIQTREVFFPGGRVQPSAWEDHRQLNGKPMVYPDDDYLGAAEGLLLIHVTAAARGELGGLHWWTEFRLVDDETILEELEAEQMGGA